MDMADIVPAHQSADNALISMIVTAAQDKSIELDRLQKLMEMRESILVKEAEIAFNVAMNAAQSEISPVTKDGENPHAHSRYATLEKVDRELRPIYTRHGFSLTFNTGTPADPKAVHVICEVRHVGGHKKEYFLEGDLDVSGAQGKSNKTNIQGLGSSVSYLRRYLTLMIFNVTLTNEDNDGNGNREAYDAMRHAADARQAARQAAEPGLQPPHKEQLRESLEMSAAEKAEKMFRPVYDRYALLGKTKRYHAHIKSFGAKVYSDFDLTTEAGKAQAQRCFSAMVKDIHDLEEQLKPKESDLDAVRDGDYDPAA